MSLDASAFRLACVLRYVNSGDYSCDGLKKVAIPEVFNGPKKS